MLVSFIYTQELETIHTGFPITVEFHVSAVVSKDDDTDVKISSIASRVSVALEPFSHLQSLNVPNESTASQDEKRMLALFRERARELVYTPIGKLFPSKTE